MRHPLEQLIANELIDAATEVRERTPSGTAGPDMADALDRLDRAVEAAQALLRATPAVTHEVSLASVRRGDPVLWVHPFVEDEPSILYARMLGRNLDPDAPPEPRRYDLVVEAPEAWGGFTYTVVNGDTIVPNPSASMKATARVPTTTVPTSAAPRDIGSIGDLSLFVERAPSRSWMAEPDIDAALLAAVSGQGGKLTAGAADPATLPDQTADPADELGPGPEPA